MPEGLISKGSDDVASTKRDSLLNLEKIIKSETTCHLHQSSAKAQGIIHLKIRKRESASIPEEVMMKGTSAPTDSPVIMFPPPCSTAVLTASVIFKTSLCPASSALAAMKATAFGLSALRNT
jgi:hypothetical protein